MGLLDSVLGQVLGGGGAARAGGGGSDLLMQIVAGMLANRPGSGGGGGGGLADLVAQFQRNGMGDVMSSWIGTGQNQPISPDQLGGVLGGDMLSELTQRTGMDQGDLLGQLSQMLPQMVDRATPEGRIPDAGLGDIGSLLERFSAPR